MLDCYKGHRFPRAIVGFAIRYYYRYKLSLRDVSEILLDRGIAVTYETIRNWAKVWRPTYAKAIRQDRSSNYSDKWHIDEVRIVIKGEIFWLWRLIDSNGEEIEILLQKRRNAKAAVRFLKKALKLTGKSPRVIVTDKLRSYKKAHRVLLKSSEHRAHKRLNNRIENSHQPTRERERQMRKFKTVHATQRFLATMGPMLNLLKVGRYKHTAEIYSQKLKNSISAFNNIVDSQYYSA